MTAELMPLQDDHQRKKPTGADDSTASVLGLIEERPPPPVVPAPAELRKRKGRKRRFRWLPRIALGSMQLSWAVAIFGTLLVFLAAGVGLYLGVKVSKPDVIPPEQWETVEVTDRFRARLPGKHEQFGCTTLGIPLKLDLCEPRGTSLFAVGLTPNELPPDRSMRETGRRLEEVCTAALRRMARRRWKETHRETIPGTHECRQLVVSIDDPRGVVPPSRFLGGYLMSESDHDSADNSQPLWSAGGQGVAIIRFYQAHNRVFVILAAGKEIDPKHPEVKYLFESFEILDSR